MSLLVEFMKYLKILQQYYGIIEQLKGLITSNSLIVMSELYIT